jgi:hypothetical protein
MRPLEMRVEEAGPFETRVSEECPLKPDFKTIADFRRYNRKAFGCCAKSVRRSPLMPSAAWESGP